MMVTERKYRRLDEKQRARNVQLRRKVSVAERRDIVAEYRTTVKNTGELAQQFALSKANITYILKKGGVARLSGRRLITLANAAADAEVMRIYKRAARYNGAVQRLDEMLRELRRAQLAGKTRLAARPDHPRAVQFNRAGASATQLNANVA